MQTSTVTARPASPRDNTQSVVNGVVLNPNDIRAIPVTPLPQQVVEQSQAQRLQMPPPPAPSSQSQSTNYNGHFQMPPPPPVGQKQNSQMPFPQQQQQYTFAQQQVPQNAAQPQQQTFVQPQQTTYSQPVQVQVPVQKPVGATNTPRQVVKPVTPKVVVPPTATPRGVISVGNGEASTSQTRPSTARTTAYVATQHKVPTVRTEMPTTSRVVKPPTVRTTPRTQGDTIITPSTPMELPSSGIRPLTARSGSPFSASTPPDIGAMITSSMLAFATPTNNTSLEELARSPRYNQSNKNYSEQQETNTPTVQIPYDEYKRLKQIEESKTIRNATVRGVTPRVETASNSGSSARSISYENYQKTQVKYYDPTGLDRFVSASEANVVPNFSQCDEDQLRLYHAKYDSYMKYLCLKFKFEMPEGFTQMSLEEKDLHYKQHVMTANIAKTTRKYKSFLTAASGITEFVARKAGMQFKEGESLVKFHNDHMEEYDEFLFELGEQSLYDPSNNGVSFMGVKVLSEDSSPMTKLMTMYLINTAVGLGINKIAQSEEFGDTLVEGFKYATNAVKEMFVSQKSSAPVVSSGTADIAASADVPQPPEPMKYDLSSKQELVALAAKRGGGGTEQVVIQSKVNPYEDGYDD